MYWESQGRGAPALVLVHGGFGLISMSAGIMSHLATHRRVVAVELQGHGHTRDTDRPFSYETFGDDLAGLVRELGLGPADLIGYSLGSGAALRAAIQHPELFRRLVVVSFPYRRDGWFPEVLEGMAHVNRGAFEQMRQAPLYRQWREVAPDKESFPALMDKTGDLLARPYDWSQEVAGLPHPTLLVYGDADSVPPDHAAEFYGLLGGGRRDAGLDGPLPGTSRLAVLPGRTHYNIFVSPLTGAVADEFLSEPDPPAGTTAR
jgi:pimeloyl-ACP methyl ester carboxylesterase